MRRLVVLFMAFLPLAMIGQNQHFKFNQDGEFASLSANTSPNSNFTLQVSRGFSTASGTSASISYTSFDIAPDFSSFTVIQITGAIPSSALTGQNTQSLVLNLDTTSQLDPNSSINQSCFVDFINFIVTCVAGPQGVIHLEFQENGVQRTRVLALGEEITTGPITTRIHQRSDNSTANAQGSIFGTPVSSGSATVGINHNSSIEVIRN